MTSVPPPDEIFEPALDEKVQATLDALGPLPATSQRYEGAIELGVSTDFVNRWISDPLSHLLVISGAYGSGKSHLLNVLTTHKAMATFCDYAIDEIPAPEDICHSIMFIDHFDEIPGYTGLHRKAPDLRLISRHLRVAKVCIVTNRPITDKGHELVRQIRYRTRLDALGVRNLEIITIASWSKEAVQTAMQQHLSNSSKHFSNIASALTPEDMAALLRPMVLRMLLTIISRHPPDWIPEYGEIYENYLEHALSWDYDHERSLINSRLKWAILKDLAYSSFSGKDILAKVAGRSTVISINTITEKVRSSLPGHDTTSAGISDAVNDFIMTNRCLYPLSGKSDTHYRFNSMAIFEYFLAQAFVERYKAGLSIGINTNQFNASILDTRMLYFARRAIVQIENVSIINMLKDDTLDNIDRLILLYLLENFDEFNDLLKAAPESYFSYLVEVGQRNDWHFMAKIARFQLVSKGFMSASEYIDYVQLSEEPAHLDVELQLCRTPTGNLDYLERRFKNINLRNSAAISVYRIAQIDPAKAKSLLEEQHFLTAAQLHECLNAFSRALESNIRRLKPAI
jgi:hypothetical protein